jgi:signal transduction histidine kinase/ActR/RegA family two-component response regulator
MQRRDSLVQRTRDRFREFNTVFPILLAGWVPAILTLFVSYTILSKTLESKILRDRQTFVQLIAHLVGDDLAGKRSLIEYYQTLPEVAQTLTAPNATIIGQQWLNQAFFSHPQIDGMFLTDAEGRLIASVPALPALIGQDLSSNVWRGGALATSGTFVSPVHPRQPDQRLATDIVGAVRTSDDRLVGYLGVSVLTERIGRRLAAIEFTDESLCEILDQKGTAIFAKTVQPISNAVSAGAAMLMKQIRQSQPGHFEHSGNIYSFTPVESTGWVAVVEQPKTVAYKPVYDLISRMTLLAAWLVVLTAVFAWLGNRFQRRQIEATRRIEREVIFNEKILANVPSGIAFVDPASRRFLQANEAFTQMARRFGNLSPERDITESTYTDVSIVPVDALERVLAFGTPFQLIEQPFKDTAGMTHFLNIHLLRLQGPQQTVQGVLYLVEDKTRDVTLRQELVDANAAKDQFLALLSHELRNPLTPVITMVEELETNVGDSASNHQALEIIRRNVELEARLIDDLLDVTRIAKGKLQLTFEVVCVPEILHRAYEICREEIASKNLEVDFQLRAKRTHVEGDPARLQQVFWNLIKNSVKFTPENGRITIETLNSTADEIEIRVTDTGIGIEREKMDKIFNAFEQGQTSITRRFGGLGLGLAISKAMVDAHRGKIRVESRGKDQGATFAITLRTVPEPAIKAGGEDGQTAAPPKQKRQRSEGCRVLVVDDHHDTCLGMKMMLERRGYRITLAHSAEQALEKARQEHFDLLISDIGLPDRSGYELMRELGTSKGLRGIALTGFGMEQDVSKARQAGFSKHLTKPINFDRLDEAIQNLLDLEPSSK